MKGEKLRILIFVLWFVQSFEFKYDFKKFHSFKQSDSLILHFFLEGVQRKAFIIVPDFR